MWPFDIAKRKAKQLKEEEQKKKVAQSQIALLEAASSAADTANHVTTQLKRHLEDSIMQFEATVRILSDGLIVCDDEGIIQAFNPAAEMIFACNSSNVLGKRILKLFRVNNTILSNMNDLWIYLNSKNKDFILEGYRCNNEKFSFEATTTKLERSDGTALILMLIRDMSNMNATTKEIEIFTQRYKTIFDLSFDGIIIVQDGNIVAANSASTKMFAGKTIDILHTSFDNLIKLNNNNNRTSDSTIEAETKLNDGTTLHLLLSSADIIWNDGPARLLTIKNVAKTTTNDISLMVVCFDKNYIVTFANAQYCTFYNLNRNDIVGKDIRTLMPESEKEAFIIRLRNLTPDNTTATYQIFVSFEGTIHQQEWIDHAVYDERNDIIEYQCTGKSCINNNNLK